MEYPDIDPTGLKWEVRSYFDVLEGLLAPASSDSTTVVAIDGHSGAGKTTLASGFAALEPHSAVIHTTDLPLHGDAFDWVRALIECLRTIEESDGVSVVFVEGVGAARREVRPWVDVVVWMHIPKQRGRRSDDRLHDENTFLAEHRAWEIADVLVAGALGQPAHNGRYGNVFTAPGPASVTKHG